MEVLLPQGGGGGLPLPLLSPPGHTQKTGWAPGGGAALNHLEVALWNRSP